MRGHMYEMPSIRKADPFLLRKGRENRNLSNFGGHTIQSIHNTHYHLLCPQSLASRQRFLGMATHLTQVYIQMTYPRMMLCWM